MPSFFFYDLEKFQRPRAEVPGGTPPAGRLAFSNLPGNFKTEQGVPTVDGRHPVFDARQDILSLIDATCYRR